MNLATAQIYAASLKDWLAPHCDRIEIAGSVRRERPNCNDLDLVVIPKLIEEKDMLGTVVNSRNLAWEAVTDLVKSGKAEFLAGGNVPGKFVNVRLKKTGVQLDVFFAEPVNFASRFLCRTGSKKHNIWLAQRALDHGGKWEPYIGVSLPARVAQSEAALIPAANEIDIYIALGLQFIEPRDREQTWIRKNLENGL